VFVFLARIAGSKIVASDFSLRRRHNDYALRFFNPMIDGLAIVISKARVLVAVGN
jgi:hypothetical protein